MAISPAVTVRLFDHYDNLVTSDNTDQVTIAIGTNAGGGTLSGTTTVTASGGVATFSNLSISQPGTGYTLRATTGSLSVTSVAFNVATATSTVIEGFDSSSTYYVVGGLPKPRYLSTAAAHDGTYGLVAVHRAMTGSIAMTRRLRSSRATRSRCGWSSPARPTAGPISVFGASSAGTLSLVAAPNTNQLLIQNNQWLGLHQHRRRQPDLAGQPLVPLGSRLGDQRQDRRQAVRQQRHHAAANRHGLDLGYYVGRHRLPPTGNYNTFGIR